MPKRQVKEKEDESTALVVSEPKGGQLASTLLNPGELLQQAITSNAGIEVMERLMGLQERWEKNEAKKAFDEALGNIRSKLPKIVKDTVVDYSTTRGRTHYKHEDLAKVIDAVAPVLSEEGLSFRWRTNSSESNAVSVTCILSHKQGHFEETTLSSKPDDSGGKNPIQAIGSAVTYLQRYTLKAALGIAASYDDDGHSAGSNEMDQREQHSEPPLAQRQQEPKPQPMGFGGQPAAKKAEPEKKAEPQKKAEPAKQPADKGKLSETHLKLQKRIEDFAAEEGLTHTDKAQILREVTTFVRKSNQQLEPGIENYNFMHPDLTPKRAGMACAQFDALKEAARAAIQKQREAGVRPPLSKSK